MEEGLQAPGLRGLSQEDQEDGKDREGGEEEEEVIGGTFHKFQRKKVVGGG